MGVKLSAMELSQSGKRYFAAALTSVITACLIMAVFLVVPFKAAYGSPLSAQELTAPSWTLSQTNVTIRDYSSPYKVYLGNYDGYDDVYAYSNDTSIVIADVVWDSSAGKYCVELQKKGIGKALVTVRDYDYAYRTIYVNCEAADFTVYTGDYTFQKSTGYSNNLYVSARSQYDEDSNYYNDNYIKSASLSNPSVASVSVSVNTSSGNTYSSAIITPKKTGSTKVTYTDQHGRQLTYTINVKSDYWKANLKSRTYVYIPYGEKKVTGWTKPGAKLTLKIGNEKHTKKANKDGKVTFKLKQAYKVNKKFTAKAKSGKLTASFKGKVYASGGCYFNGTIWSCRKYMPVRAYNIHKGDYLVLSCGKEKHKKKFTKKTSGWSGYLYMNKNMREYRYRTVKLVMYNKYGQKLSNSSWYIRF